MVGGTWWEILVAYSRARRLQWCILVGGSIGTKQAVVVVVVLVVVSMAVGVPDC